MDTKELMRQMVLQVCAIANIFTGTSRRLAAAVALLQDLATNKWDAVWTLATNQPSAAFARMRSIVADEHKDDYSDPYFFVADAKPASPAPSAPAGNTVTRGDHPSGGVTPEPVASEGVEKAEPEKSPPAKKK